MASAPSATTERQATVDDEVAGPLSVTELSQCTGLRLSTSSTMVGQLSGAGLLERVEDDDDRRRTIVHLPRECKSCHRVGSGTRWRWPWPELRAVSPGSPRTSAPRSASAPAERWNVRRPIPPAAIGADVPGAKGSISTRACSSSAAASAGLS
jgi:hypothetical protein